MFSGLKFAIRSLLKTPWFTAVVAVTLALGIAANTAVFSWTRGVLLQPLRGISEPQRLYDLETASRAGNYDQSSYPDFRDYRDTSRSLASVIAFHDQPLTMGPDEHAERVWGQFVSGTFFDVLGVRPIAGRFFSTEEQADVSGKYPVAVIGARLWRQHFHSDLKIIGKTIRLNRRYLTVVGVAPDEFAGTTVGSSYDVWMPLAMESALIGGPAAELQTRDNRRWNLLARLKAGVPLTQARAEIQTISERLARSYPESNDGVRAVLIPLSQASYGVQSVIGTLLKTLLGAGAVLLLIVCANVANLMLVRATSRQREFSIRLALGASRARVVGQLLLESLLLSGVGCAIGVVLAQGMSGWLGFFIPNGNFPVRLDFPVDPAVLAFTLSISALTGLAFGLAPALQTIRDGRIGRINDQGRGASPRSGRLGGYLVVAEIALALVVLIGASLFFSSFRHVKRMDPGFDPSNVLLAELNLSEAGYDKQQGLLFMRHLRERLETLPGVRAVSFGRNVPLGFSPGSWEEVSIAGYVPHRGESMRIHSSEIWPGYFDLMRIGLVAGREFTDGDDSGSKPVVMINEALAQRFFPGREPIGRTLRVWGVDWTVIGVVKDIKYQSLGEAPRPYFYSPMQQTWQPHIGVDLHVRTAGPPERLLPELQREVRSVDSRVHLFETFALKDFIGESWFALKTAATLLGVLSTLALVLAALGLFSVMAYAVSQRTAEIGIRMALGAQRADVYSPILGRALRLAVTGIVIGLGLSLALTRLVASQLIGISATDPITYIAVPLLLCAVALAASYIPARRAARIDPLIALRAE